MSHAPIIPVNSTWAPLQAFVDELARSGLTHAVTSPGSRNAPLVLTLAGDPRIDAVSVLDERSAGFVALGLAKATRRPVAVTCTSGSAAANLMPAVVEAWESRVPLIVLTADRPPELRDVGAGQAIDQLKIYGSFAKWFVEVGNHPPGRDSTVHHRALACRAYATAAGDRPGPVHLNFGLREPLAPIPEEIDPEPWQGRPDGAPWVRVHEPDTLPHSDVVEEIADAIAASPRGAIVCGPTSDPIAHAVARLAATAGWPLLAEPTSGVRCGPHDRSHVFAHYDVLLRAAGWAAESRAQTVIRVGDTPTSKPLRAWLAGAERQVVIDPHAAWHEPTRTAETIVRAAPIPTLEMLVSVLEQDFPARRDPGWLDRWLRADALVPAALAAMDEPFEPLAYTALAGALPDGAPVWVSSSMPIRDVETFFPSHENELRFLANRGANGIDGMASSTLGAALANGGRAWLLTGELALIHDLGGLAAARRAAADLTIVCVNNGGGGIFDFLPVAEHADRELYERHVLTPSGLPLREVAALADLPHVVANSARDVRDALDEPALIEYRTDRQRNVAARRALFAAVARELEGA
ncbi:MAG: 2-succinyl-5-enolpyruvyl-6-hydroxy-3-cyclohexene-carboxylate synthase [Thermoleophilales bacterium]|nr:2-succinyl-5-enolpyruvyl-6-hydroxy-3-cyclohexene-carboxylate synthase [Thermoleophilales bacterium]